MNQQGFILKVVIIVIALVLVLSFFNVNIKSTVEKPAFQQNIEYVKGGVLTFWDTYIRPYAFAIWDNLFLAYFWNTFTSNMQKTMNGEPNDIQMKSPYVTAPQQ